MTHWLQVLSIPLGCPLCPHADRFLEVQRDSITHVRGQRRLEINGATLARFDNIACIRESVEKGQAARGPSLFIQFAGCSSPNSRRAKYDARRH